MKILHLDSTDSYLSSELEKLGFENSFDFKSTKKKIENLIFPFNGIIIRSRIKIDKSLIDKAINLKFIARFGSGLENIDLDYANKKNIKIISAPEGNSNAVAEHALGMLLSLMNNIPNAHKEITNGMWNRESNRGFELKNKTIGLIGYGNTGKSFAKILSGFNVKTIFYDLKSKLEDNYAKEVSIKEIQKNADVISLHTSLTDEAFHIINKIFIDKCNKQFWVINTARGQCINTKDLITGIKQNKILGAALDVLEFEKNSFEKLSLILNSNTDLIELMKSKKIIITPHIAGWTYESKINLSKVVLNKIKKLI